MKKLEINRAIRAAVAAAVVGAMTAFSGCYVGRAEFRGEDMRVYPLFNSQHVAQDCADGSCSEVK